ncbi:MAG: xanthine dehydrogenase family protein molybdopterin-binding subunit [Chloroflexi bacterium]|nr:xanthine dehydrogenase family protein molybdopterin-binding subunit [Chloroflexota bacterium]
MRIERTQVEFEGRIEEREAIVEEEHVEPWGPDAALRIVGQPTARVDGLARVTGQARYTHDIQWPGMLVGRFLRSPHPHARLVSIDSSRAEALAGVWLVWHRHQPPPVTRMAGREIFAQELSYQGSEVAFVLADDERIAEDALGLIDVEYEQLPFTHDLGSATAKDAPPTWLGSESNLVDPKGELYERGDIEQGMRDAEVMVDLTFSTQTAAHCCLETHGSVARWEGDQLSVWHSTQAIYRARSSLAEALDLPLDKLRIVCEYVGGGFGSKFEAENYTLLAALAARETGRPVKVLLDREEEHLVAGYRPPSRQRVRLGARQDGTLTFIDHEAWVITGAYGGSAPVVGGPSKDLYRCPNVRTMVWTVRANLDAHRAFRAPGYVEGTFALEGAMDALAQKLGMDPLALRLKNYAKESPARQVPYTFKGLRRAYELGAKRFGWAEREERRNQQGPWRRGFGMASQIWGGGGGPPAKAIVKLHADGTADVLVGVQDLGTGTKTVLAQVAAEALGLPLDHVRIIIGDTLSTPYGPGSGGSVTLASTTPAVRNAAHDALRQLLELVAYMIALPDAKPGDFVLQEGQIIYRPDPNRRVSFLEATAKMGNYTIVGYGARGPNPAHQALNTFGAHFAEVEVHEGTGQVRVKKVIAVHEIGRVVNPMTAQSQVFGGVIMSMGFGLMEERVIDARHGLQLTANLEDYTVPTMADVPEIEVAFVGEADPKANSVGSKGLGEPPIIPLAAAVANAVSDAIGMRITDLPITTDRVLAALRSRQVGGEK